MTGRVIGDKLKIFTPSKAQRASRNKISDKRKLKSHTYLLSPSRKTIERLKWNLSKNCPKPKESPSCWTLCRGNHTFNFLVCTHNPANLAPAPRPKTNYWEESMKMMKTNKLPLSAPTSLQNTISTNSVKMDKSPPNQVQPQISGPSTSSSTPQESLAAQILQSLVKEVHVLTSNIASLLAALQSQSLLSHNIQ
ncbi:hypothetical protein CEXT_623181 [Caerostris extrusa]|uniref:Uncharacterized protein n=1 Tax=Caerostris extrusa TaxID=172846 RepID=A0AAV4PPA4_CAEEX|nr:hypothetical protein CEXT_623181 [Caerostris extrusa]